MFTQWLGFILKIKQNKEKTLSCFKRISFISSVSSLSFDFFNGKNKPRIKTGVDFSKALPLWVWGESIHQHFKSPCVCLVYSWQIKWNACFSEKHPTHFPSMNEQRASRGYRGIHIQPHWKPAGLPMLYHNCTHSGFHMQFTKVCTVLWQGDLSLTPLCHFHWGPLQWGKVQESWLKRKHTFDQLTIAFSSFWLFLRSFWFLFCWLPLTPPSLYNSRLFFLKIITPPVQRGIFGKKIWKLLASNNWVSPWFWSIREVYLKSLDKRANWCMELSREPEMIRRSKEAPEEHGRMLDLLL